MGSARERAWSHSRQALYDSCPRAFFFQYFPWGEPEEDSLRLLRRARTAPLLAGSVAHDAVRLALSHYRASGRVLTDLAATATARYDLLVAQSARLAEAARRGGRVPSRGEVLLHHLTSGSSEAVEAAARESVADALGAFEASEAWLVLRGSDPRRWVPLVADEDERPSFVASPELGFEGAVGLRIYAVYDLALRLGGEFVILDWKTGRLSDAAVSAARRQCAAYALWAMGRGVGRERLRTQPYFLSPGETWDPRPVEEDNLDAVRRAVERHDAMERAVLEVRTDASGRPEFLARREDFPAAPRPHACHSCKFRSICAEARNPDAAEPSGKAVRKGRRKAN